MKKRVTGTGMLQLSMLQVTMRLVRRLRGSTTVEIAPARGQLDSSPEHILPLHNVNDSPYCKLFSANKQQVNRK